MFRAVTKLNTLQRAGRATGGSRQRQYAAPVELSSSGVFFPSSSSSSNSTTTYDNDNDAASFQTNQLRRFYSVQLWQTGNSTAGFMWIGRATNTANIASFGVHASSRRGFASNAGDNSSSNNNNNSADGGGSSVDDTLEKLFKESEAIRADPSAEPWVDGVSSVASSGGLDFVPTWYNPADQCINLIMKFQELAGCELGWAIVGTTMLLRIALFPVVVSGQKSSSRMAHLQPEMIYLRKKFESIPNPTTEQKAQLGNQIRDLFQKYEVKPLRAMVAPFMQFPFFMGMFFGLKKMPDYFPQEMQDGGMLWFPDLTMTDPNYILPGICFLTFLGTVELGKEQMMASNPQNAPMMINVFRGLSVMMIPICINFHAGMLCYWTISNLFTLIQIGVMKIPAFKSAVGIWEPPKPVPGLHAKDEGFVKAAQKMMDEMQGKPTSTEAKLKQHNERIENKKKVTELSRNSRERRRRSIKQKKR